MKVQLKDKKTKRVIRSGDFLSRGTYVKVIEGAVVINETKGDNIETWTGFDLSKHYVTINQGR